MSDNSIDWSGIFPIVTPRPMTITVDYEWICNEILSRSKSNDLQEAIRILKELEAEQND